MAPESLVSGATKEKEGSKATRSVAVRIVDLAQRNTDQGELQEEWDHQALAPRGRGQRRKDGKQIGAAPLYQP